MGITISFNTDARYLKLSTDYSQIPLTSQILTLWRDKSNFHTMEEETQSPNLQMSRPGFFPISKFERAQSNGDGQAAEWTTKEERAVKWKSDSPRLRILLEKVD